MMAAPDRRVYKRLQELENRLEALEKSLAEVRCECKINAKDAANNAIKDIRRGIQ
jgi:ribosomal protein L29